MESAQEESIDYKKWLFLIAQNWYLYVIVLGITISASLIYKRYAVNVYSVRSSVLVKMSAMANNPLAQGAYYSTKLAQKNLANEINIVKSQTTIEKVVDKMNLNVSYFLKGNIRNAELYPNAPIKVEYDSSLVNIPFGILFRVEILNNNEFAIKIDADDEFKFDSPKYAFGSNVSFNGFTFKVIRNIDGVQVQPKENYYFKFNDRITLVKEYRAALQANPLEKESSILVFSLTSTHPPKELNFLNILADVYIVESLEDKNFSDNKTIEFIDDQLGVINDTLSKIESNLTSFQQKYNSLDLKSESNVISGKIRNYETQKEKFLLELKYFDYLKKYLSERVDYDNLIVPASVGIVDPTLQDLLSQVLKLQLKKNTDFKLTNPNSPFYKDNENKIQEIKRNIFELVTNIENNHKIFIEDVGKKIRMEEGKSSGVIDSDRRFTGIKRIYDVNSSIYNFFLAKESRSLHQ